MTLDIDSDPDQRLAKDEWGGARLSLACKAAAILAMFVYVITTFEPPTIWWPLGLIGLFIATWCAQVWLGVNRPTWTSARVSMIIVDATALCVMIAIPNPGSGFELSPQMTFRAPYFPILVLYIVSVGFTYRTLAPLTAGATCTIVWGILSYSIYLRPETIGWSQITSTQPSGDDLLLLFGERYFLDGHARQIEVAVLLATTILVSGIVWRSRRQVAKIIRVEGDRMRAQADELMVREALGKYVPETVVQEIIRDRGRLTPQSKLATVMFVDIAGFTELGEKVGARSLIGVLNAFFETAGGIITDHGGTINQFQGDAILASFNVPLEDADHARKSLLAATALLEATRDLKFDGERISIRIGVHTGELAAGAVGSSNRLSYTVHGSTVNVAARLEQLNKELGTSLIYSAGVMESGGSIPDARSIGFHAIRGVMDPIELYTI